MRIEFTCNKNRWALEFMRNKNRCALNSCATRINAHWIAHEISCATSIESMWGDIGRYLCTSRNWFFEKRKQSKHQNQGLGWTLLKSIIIHGPKISCSCPLKWCLSISVVDPKLFFLDPDPTFQEIYQKGGNFFMLTHFGSARPYF